MVESRQGTAPTFRPPTSADSVLDALAWSSGKGEIPATVYRRQGDDGRFYRVEFVRLCRGVRVLVRVSHEG